MKETIKAIVFFALGLLFYSKLLDKPEIQNVIKRLKMKKGANNTMNTSLNKSSSETIYASDTRKQVIEKWKQLKQTKK